MQKDKFVIHKSNQLSIRFRKYKVLYPILIIGIAYYIIFQYLPIFWGFIISFKDMKVGSTIAGASWVGLDNYIEVFTNKEMFKLLRNTLTISISRLVFTFIPPIILTICIFDLKNTVFKRISQTIVYIPHFFSWVVIYGIVFAFFSGDGFINNIISIFDRGGTSNFLTSTKAFIPILVGSQIWKEAGWGTILYFAALTGVSPELYEAAKIDGAGPIRRTMAVTLPAIIPVITFSLIMAMVSILNNDFEQILLFYNAAVYDVGDIIDTWVYRVGLGKMEYGLGSAVNMLKAVVSMILILIANTFSKKIAGRGMF